ncbi:hypothetical protein EG329_013477 [Mollisiaceae sp. DMI_Dod_QoI]|nr:hypothetical protein EG329_013477 [Helotiales sp. DMI_Dod_QoI]
MTRFSSAQRRRAKMQSSEKRPIGPWRAFRIGLRIVLFSFLTWLVLALLWAFLPSPATIQSEQHAAPILRSGSPLTVAYPSSKWHNGQYNRQGFALDYTLHNADSPSASIAISGYPQLIPLINHEFTPNNGSEITQNFQAVARTGDTDGANLPWFTFADSVLLYWWIHRENVDIELSARWVLIYEYETPEAMLPVLRSRQLEILLGNRIYQPLLTIDIENRWGDERVKIMNVTMGEESDSPTWTYPIRVAIIYVLAPTTVFVNDWFGSTIGYGFQAFETVFLILFGILWELTAPLTFDSDYFIGLFAARLNITPSNMALSLATRLQSITNDLLSHPIFHTRPNVLKSALFTLSIPLIYFTYIDYRSWYNVGRGGLPHNIIGYVIQTILSPLKASRFDTSFVSKPKVMKKSGPAGERAYLKDEDVPQRKGDRPEVCGWILPQRQLDQKASEKSRARYEALIHSLAVSQPTKLSVNTSVLERGGPALFINHDVSKHPGAFGTRNEIAHVHESDGSMHVSIAPKDAKLVIERGWGERFGLSGSVLPVTYTMIYAPRPGEEEEEEMKIVERIIRAGVKFMLGEEVEG